MQPLRVDAQMRIELAQAATECDEDGYSGREKVHELQHPWCCARIKMRIGQVPIWREADSRDLVPADGPTRVPRRRTTVLRVEDASRIIERASIVGATVDVCAWHAHKHERVARTCTQPSTRCSALRRLNCCRRSSIRRMYDCRAPLTLSIDFLQAVTAAKGKLLRR